jgi:hypothetical protein
LGLARVQRLAPALVPTEEVAASARRIHDDEALLASNRSTALLVLAAYDAEGARARALALLASPASSLALQTAALGALGSSAAPEDRALVSQHQDSPDIRLRTAARTALAKRFGTQFP